jgi:phosphinothricin acetyltransferase
MNLIRKSFRDDLPAIVEVYNTSIPGRLATADLVPVTVEDRRAWFEAHGRNRPLWVSEEDGEIAGWLGLQSFYGRPAYDATVEVSVYVAPSQQRRGIAGALLAHAIDQAPQLGVTTLLGFIFGHNAPSLALFQRFGFDTWGRLPRIAVLDGIERDLVILGRRLEGEKT